MVDRSIHTMKEKMNNFSGTITVNGTDEHLKDVPSNIVIKEHIHSHDDLQNGQTSELTLPEKQMETLKDLYNQEYFDDEDDEDSDWEPVQRFVSKKWFCTNCTMPNFDDVNCCDICGEHKNSGILLHGCFASPTGGVIIDSDKLDVTVKCKDAEKLEGRTAICFDERMLLHSEVEMKSIPHPERPDRLRVIASSLSYAGIYPGKCLLIPPREVTEDELHLVHSLDHIQAVNCTSHLLASYFTSDTYANEHSARAARLAAGFCSDLAISVLTGKARNGFALIRPPGHHAGVKQAMGFCLHNNAAVAAKAAQAAGAKKVLIVDWDVHHGNGTQEIFDGDNTVLYISLHRHENGRFYPGTGAAEEVGIMEGMGYSVNIPWKTGGVGDDDYLFAFQHIVLPIATEFAPDLTIISSGFDAARGDPLGCCDVTPAGYAQMTYMLSSLSGGKLLAILEGGYNLRSISSSSLAVVKVLLGEVPKKDPNDVVPTKGCLQTVIEVLRIHSEYWPVLKGSCASIQSKWGLAACCSTNQVNRKRDFGPIWWKWGSKSLAYRLLYGGGLKRVRKEV